jgi:hypothetical protein
MCVEHEATTKTQPRNGIRIRCHDDDLRFETIIASKSTTPAIQSRPTSVPSEARHATRCSWSPSLAETSESLSTARTCVSATYSATHQLSSAGPTRNRRCGCPQTARWVNVTSCWTWAGEPPACDAVGLSINSTRRRSVTAVHTRAVMALTTIAASPRVPGTQCRRHAYATK